MCRFGDSVYLFFIITPPGETVERAWKRGIETGRYKAVDERVSEHLIDAELSVGDFVLSGGEPAALCVVDAIARLLPDVVGDFDSVESDSFHSGLLDAPYYTRPAEYRDWKVPEVLTSGNHGAIARWRQSEALERTRRRRPDLLDSPAGKSRG